MFDAMFRADAIIVLGCRIQPSGRLGGPAARRAAAAVSAYRAEVAPRIVASGGRRWGEQVEARAFRQALVRAGVPAESVIEELCSLTTLENAIFSAAILRRLIAQGGQSTRPPRAAIVTCPFHMPRALANFRAAGVDAVAFPAAAVRGSLPSRTYLRAHEIVCSWLDAQAMRRAAILVERAHALAASSLDDAPPPVARRDDRASWLEAP